MKINQHGYGLSDDHIYAVCGDGERLVAAAKEQMALVYTPEPGRPRP